MTKLICSSKRRTIVKSSRLVRNISKIWSNHRKNTSAGRVSTYHFPSGTRAAYVGYPGSFEASRLFSVDSTWSCSLLRSPDSASSGFGGSIGSPMRWNMTAPFTGTRSSECIIWLLCALAYLEAVIFRDLFLSFFLGTPSRPFLNPCPSVPGLSTVRPSHPAS